MQKLILWLQVMLNPEFSEFYSSATALSRARTCMQKNITGATLNVK